MRKSRERSSRRRFLRQAGITAATLPFLGGLVSRIGRAQTGDAPLRLLFMFTGNQHRTDHWLPTSGGERDFALGPIMTPFEPLREKLIVLHGLRGGGRGGHSGGMSETLTGQPSPVASGTGIAVASGGPSIDQLFARRYQGETPIASMQVGVGTGNQPKDYIVYSESGLPILARSSPSGVFDQIFGVTNQDPAVAAARRANQQSVLDSIASDLTGIQTRLDPEARQLLDEHLTLVRQREMELAHPPDLISCSLHDRPTLSDDPLLDQFENVVAAFRCGVTNVITYQVGGYGGEGSDYDRYGIVGGHHNIAHNGVPNAADALRRIQLLHADKLAYAASALDAVPEGDGTMLDNTVIVWCSELGLEAPPDDPTALGAGHSRSDLPVLIVGGGNAGLDLGRYVNLGGDVAYQHFLYTLTQVFGHTDLSSFGEEGTEMIAELMT